MEWKFERVESNFEIPVGTHRVRIAEVEKAVSQAQRDMLKITLDVSGYNAHLYHYIVFMDEMPEITNRKLTELFDSFGIADDNFNLQSWKGLTGACYVKQDEEGRAKISYFIKREKQLGLPAWQEPNGAKPQPTPTPQAGDWVKDKDDGDIPF